MSKSRSAQITSSKESQQDCCHRWQQADFDERREMIVDAVLDILQQQGLKAVTIRRVASQLQLGAMTLYTYFKNQNELHRELVRKGFSILQSNCEQLTTDLHTPEGWRAGAQAYLRFAVSNPNLYKLMFDTPMSSGDEELLRGGFQPLLDKVSNHLAEEGLSGKALERTARKLAGRYWIGLHGLATLAIASRLAVLEGDLDELLDDLLPRIAPTGNAWPPPTPTSKR